MRYPDRENEIALYLKEHLDAGAGRPSLRPLFRVAKELHERIKHSTPSI